MGAISGASVEFIIDGVIVGIGTGVSINETTDYFPVRQLGNAFVLEHVATAQSTSVSADFITLEEKSLIEQGVWPSSAGTLPDATDTIVAFGAMTGIIRNRTTGKVIRTVEGLKPESRSMRVDQGSIFLTGTTFRAVRVLNEQES